MIALETVRFNLQTVVASGPLTIRKNATEWLAVPEWRRGGSLNFEDSRGAFAVSGLDGGKLMLAASFSTDQSSVRDAVIRAVDNTFAPMPMARNRVTSILQRVSTANAEPPITVAEQTVTFRNGETGAVNFEITDPAIDRTRVGLHDCEWQWQYRLPHDATWHRLVVSRHRIYITLDIPYPPWQQTPDKPENTQILWAEVLDYACRWAAGAQTKREAAEAVTRNIMTLAPHLIMFDAPGGGSSHYAWSTFDCSAFLDRLRGGIGNGAYVNGSDCAAIVTTFANALGCDLWQSRMGFGFAVNPVLVLGAKLWQRPGLWPGLTYHEVAWENNCGEDDRIYDAAMTVDGGPDPTSATHTPQAALGMLFGHATDTQETYRNRFAAPAGRYPCEPQPQTRRRLSVR